MQSEGRRITRRMTQSASASNASSPRSSSPKPQARAKDIYALQVRAFIDAADEVDVDEDVMKDILNGFPGHIVHSRVDLDSLDDGHENESSSDDLLDVSQFDVETMGEYVKEAEEAWTKPEIRQMMHHLKERGMKSYIEEYVDGRQVPIPRLLYAFGICLCKQLRKKLPKTLLFFLQVALNRELLLREKLPQYNTFDDAVRLIREARRIIVLTGAGISVSCGIPDFRSRDGLYATLKTSGDYELDDPQQMFDIQYFKEKPEVFYQIYPSNFRPSPCHRFIKLLENKTKLLRNYTQNIDTLETVAGVKNVLQCHGSFATASCINCRRKVPGSAIESAIMNQQVPLCSRCVDATKRQPVKKSRKKKRGAAKKSKSKSGWESEDESETDVPVGILKPDITFFGEKLADDFERLLLQDREVVDLLLVIGTSLKVSPVSESLSYLPHSVPQILINKTPIRHINPDIMLLGSADVIVQHICYSLGWSLPLVPVLKLVGTARRVGQTHVCVFAGAEQVKWLQDLQEQERAKEESSRVSSSTAVTRHSGESSSDPDPLISSVSGQHEPTGRFAKKRRTK